MPRPRRGMLSRPSLDEVRDLARHVDEALQRALPDAPAAALDLVELGINHEQQHQELILTDILATFAENPLEPAYGALDRRAVPRARAAELPSQGREGMVEIGASATASPSTASGRATRRCSTRTRIANRRVTNGEWREFIADGGYRDADAVAVATAGTGSSAKASQRPLYWRERRHALHPRRAPRRSTPPRRSPISAITRPTPSPAGPARACRPKPNGKPLRRLGRPAARQPARPSRRRVSPRPGGGHVRRRLGMDQSAFLPTPASARGGHGRRI